MLKNLKKVCLDRQTLARRIQVIMADENLPKTLHTLWFDILEQVLQEADHDLKELPTYYLPKLSGDSICYNDVDYPFAVKVFCATIDLPYETLCKVRGAYLQNDKIQWDVATARGDLELSISFNCKIPREDLELLELIGVRKVRKVQYTDTSYVCAVPEAKNEASE